MYVAKKTGAAGRDEDVLWTPKTIDFDCLNDISKEMQILA